MKYTQNYKVLWLIMIGFMAACFAIPLLDNFFSLTANTSLALIMLVTLVFIELLLYVIYRGEFIYWINNGPSFKEASAMSSDERKAYALLFFKSYQPYFVVGLLITLIHPLVPFAPMWLLSIITTLIIIAWALSTLRFTYRANRRR